MIGVIAIDHPAFLGEREMDASERIAGFAQDADAVAGDVKFALGVGVAVHERFGEPWEADPVHVHSPRLNLLPDGDGAIQVEDTPVVRGERDGIRALDADLRQEAQGRVRQFLAPGGNVYHTGLLGFPYFSAPSFAI